MHRAYFDIYHATSSADLFLGRGCLYLADRPGALADAAGMFAAHGLNIIFFHYNRSEHPNRVIFEVRGRHGGIMDIVAGGLSRCEYLTGQLTHPYMALEVMDTGSILTIEVELEHRPGTLGKFAKVLAGHGANIIHMTYHEDVSERSAHCSIATQNPEEVDILLKDLNEQGYYYSIICRGAGKREIEDIIGLNLVERFFHNLRKLLNTDDIDRLKKIVRSSQRLSDALIAFSREAGKFYNAGEITTNILAFASASLLKTGHAFSYRKLPSLDFGEVRVHVFRLPTGGNMNVMESDEEMILLDCGYGLYFSDVKAMFRENRMDPGKVTRIYLSHADADHAGMSGHFAREFGTRVYLHGEAEGILEHENRSWGSKTPLDELNHCFTVLVNEFTQFSVPADWIRYSSGDGEWMHGFPVLDHFEIAGNVFTVLGSMGGHVPGQVFILSHDLGVMFTSDYLLSVESLSPWERDVLNLPKFMMSSTNVDSGLFRQEMNALRELVRWFGEDLRMAKKPVFVVPGHGDYYPHEALRNAD